MMWYEHAGVCALTLILASLWCSGMVVTFGLLAWVLNYCAWSWSELRQERQRLRREEETQPARVP